MRVDHIHFRFYAASVVAVAMAGIAIVGLFMGTGPTRDQGRAIDGPAEPVTTAARRP
ncbi:hypothetical protein [Methylobacterium sp. Leaf118]|uniref:hypothetical protein n=1 Tax=Methylobacterium sp. Leaf118 TaxID=2876562 RepID=UPI001E342E5A|nr:hypothetical protein [Methylobacterium sp. Leaf118]